MSIKAKQLNMLVIRSHDAVPLEELEVVNQLAKIHEVNAVVVDRTKEEPIPQSVGGECFDLVYLAGHGNFQYFERSCGETPQLWEQVAAELCQSACLRNGAVVFCACCNGGMRNVARSILRACQNVHFVCGPKSTVTTHTMTLGFHTFLYNFSFRRAGADEAVEVVSHATGHKFLAHDRHSEMQSNLEKSQQSPSIKGET